MTETHFAQINGVRNERQWWAKKCPHLEHDVPANVRLPVSADSAHHHGNYSLCFLSEAGWPKKEGRLLAPAGGQLLKCTLCLYPVSVPADSPRRQTLPGQDPALALFMNSNT